MSPMGQSTVGPAGTWLATFRREGKRRFEVSATPGASHSTASEGTCTVLFDGLLHSRREWLDDFSGPAGAGASDASLVLNAYLHWGEELLDRIKGLFALIVWDADNDLLLCARDPHGMHPFFYADDGGDLFLSASAEALVQHPRIPDAVDRVALADHLCHRWPKLESTYFEAVRRLPGGYALRVRAGIRSVERYWDPIPPGKPIEYVSDEEAGRFTELLDQAVERCLPDGQAAIYLSGGLDSVSIAALAQEQLHEKNTGPLLALSLVFEHSAANEEIAQRAVAAELGLPQKIVTVSDAVGPKGLLASALEMSASRPAPMINLWNPAYAFLARYAAEQGCELILTGNGGDEWLEAGVHEARTAWRTLDLATLYRLWATMQRSYRFSKGTVARNLFWTYGLRPNLRQGGASMLRRAAPGLLTRLERRRLARTTPHWVAPDPQLQEQMFERYQAHRRTKSRGALDSPMVAYELEEFHESGRELGVRLLHPFWDADLTAFLARIPPRLLMRGGYSKGLVRESLTWKFPALGFDRHRKVVASGFYRSVLITEGADAWKRMGGAQALAELGIVDPVALDAHMNHLFEDGDGGPPSETDPGKAYQIWYVLSLEAWLRPRIGRPAEAE
jgi:asparagine synthase (glutamine-hydrolysing)